MAKNTHAQEVSTGTADSYTETELSDPHPPVAITRAELGEVDKPSVGTSSTASSKKESAAERLADNVPAPVLGTENRSQSPDEDRDSDADSADGATRRTAQGTPRKSEPKKNKKRAGTRSTEDEDDDFDF